MTGAHVLGTAAGALPEEGWWLPRAATDLARRVDSVFTLNVMLAILVVAVVAGSAFVLAVSHRRRRAGEGAAGDPGVGSQVLVAVVAGGLAALAFFSGLGVFVSMTSPPPNPYEIRVTGEQWTWYFTYPNDHSGTSLHLPSDRPVLLRMASRDVTHSFSIPSFRLKRDVVPGREAMAWLDGAVPGEYEAVCARYCGEGFSHMAAAVVVHEPGEFEAWLKSVADFLSTLPPAEAGEKLYAMHGCTQCHTTDGTRKTGPSFKGIFGHEVRLKDGSTVVVDEEYIRESILDPQAKVVEGFEPVMPPFAGRVKPEEVDAIIEFIRSLSELPEKGSAE